MNHIQTKDDVRLRVKDWGRGRAVVMMHGWPLSSDTFDDLGMAIANAGMRAIAYDRRGFGRSQQPWDGYDYDTLADDLAAVIDQTNAEDVTLVGFSMGGGEVARYLTRHGASKIKQAVLIALDRAVHVEDRRQSATASSRVCSTAWRKASRPIARRSGRRSSRRFTASA